MMYDIKNLLNDESLKNVQTDTLMIHYKQLVPNNGNNYSLKSIKELAQSIELVGLLQLPLVKETREENEEGDDLYLIVAGHRRHKAIEYLVEVLGKTEYEYVQCCVLPQEENANLSQIKLHLANILNRDISEFEKMEAIAELEELFKKLKLNGQEILGSIRKNIAEFIGLSETQVQRYMTIGAKADDEIKAKLKDGKVTVKEAYNETKKKQKKTKVVTTADKAKVQFVKLKKIVSEVEDENLKNALQVIEEWINNQ
jgi:ParB-like nuclease domain.